MPELSVTMRADMPTWNLSDTKDTMCRNVLIYGHCRFQDQGCAFNHDQTKNATPGTASNHSQPATASTEP